MTGDEVSDFPSLVEAKLKGRLAPASKERLQLLRAAYDAARSSACDGGVGREARQMVLDSIARVPE